MLRVFLFPAEGAGRGMFTNTVTHPRTWWDGNITLPPAHPCMVLRVEWMWVQSTAGTRRGVLFLTPCPERSVSLKNIAGSQKI